MGLWDEATLPEDVAPESVGEPRGDALLVTGATGFLGRTLVAELLGTTRDVVVTPVRADDDAHALRRVRGALEAAARWDAEWEPRLVAWAADVAEPGLGLDAAQLDFARDRVREIYHCAASVRGGVPYRALRRVNVGGTVHALRLACSGSPARFHFVSTVAAVPRPPGRAATESDPSSYPSEPALPSGYAESKWVAERLVDAAAARGLMAVTYRLGAVGGDTRTGLCNERDYRWLIVRASIETGRSPVLDSSFSWIPVDETAAAIVALGRAASDGVAYHLMGAGRMHWLEVFSLLRRRGYTLRVADPELWAQHVVRLDREDLAGVTALMSQEAAGAASPISDDETAARLDDLGIPRRRLDEDLFGAYLDAMTAAGAIPPPPGAAASPVQTPTGRTG